MPLSQNMSMTELSRFRTRICERKALHGVCELDERCPFSHCLSWHRRNPYEYAYRPNLCPNVVFQNENKKMRVKNYCQRGRMCMFSHTKEEQMYHVLVYKTQLCREYPLCTKHYCPFAHGLDELRNPETIEFDPVQGPEVIERQRLVHDCNKFSEIEQIEEINDLIVKNKESSTNGDICFKNNKHSHRNKVHTTINSGNSPKRGGRNAYNKSNSNSNSNHNSNNQSKQFISEPMKGELTPINNANESPVTPSTGCETPLHTQNRNNPACKNESRKLSNRDLQRRDVDRISSSPNGKGNFLVNVDNNNDDLIHARDHINIPPPPYNAIGLNFPCNDNVNSNSNSSSLLTNYGFGRFSWGEYEEGSNSNKLKNTQEPICNVDDYGNGSGVEQMSYLMHLQLLSLSDNPVDGQFETNNNSEWSLSNPSFGLSSIYGTRQNGESNISHNQCNFTGEINSNPDTSHCDAIRCTSEGKVVNSQLYLSNNHFDDYGFDFINDCNVSSHDKSIRDLRFNRGVESNVVDIGASNNSWSLFHHSLFNTGNKEGAFWTEGKWENITTNY